MNVKIVELNGGEYVGVSAVEITSIPTMSILKDQYMQGTDIETEYKHNFISKLSFICF